MVYLEKGTKINKWTLLEDARISNMKVPCQCECGLIKSVRVADIKIGQSKSCWSCAATSKYTKLQFIDLIHKSNGKMKGEYKGYNSKIEIECSNGHIVNVTPKMTIQSNRIPCAKCSIDNGSKRNRIRVFDMLAENNVELIGPYINVSTFITIRCPNAHTSKILPYVMFRDDVVCRYCKNTTDHVYLVYNPSTDIYKIGITRNPRTRLREHKRDGFIEVIKLYKDIPNALEIEQKILRAIRKLGYSPVYGHEYFRDPPEWEPIIELIDREAEKCIS